MVKFLVPLLAILMLLAACGIAEPPPGPGTGTEGAGTTGTGEAGAGGAGAGGGTGAGEGAGTGGGTEDTGTGGGDSSVYSNGTSTGGIGAGESGNNGTQQTSLKNREIFYESGGWKVYGTLYESQSKTPDKTIILVHAKDKDRNNWPISLIERLHEEFPDALVLAIDLRGHGKSTNLGTWQGFNMAAFKDMKTDVIEAQKYIEDNYPNADEYYVVGASIGSSAAILAAAQETGITKVVMISPGMSYDGVDISRAVEDYPHDVLAVAANGDAYSANAVSEISELRIAAHTDTVIYPGTAHGTDLFAASEGGLQPLDDKIIDFLK